MSISFLSLRQQNVLGRIHRVLGLAMSIDRGYVLRSSEHNLGDQGQKSRALAPLVFARKGKSLQHDEPLQMKGPF